MVDTSTPEAPQRDPRALATFSWTVVGVVVGRSAAVTAPEAAQEVRVRPTPGNSPRGADHRA
jgi:hypothetical protein